SGALSATFTITTTSVAAPVTATISATYIATQTAALTVNHDGNPPTITITVPGSGAVITEGQPVNIEATIVDAEVGVKTATATLEGVATAATLVKDPVRPNVWTGSIVAPDV